jgi:hypothetical protein
VQSVSSTSAAPVEGDRVRDNLRMPVWHGLALLHARHPTFGMGK